MLIDMTKDPQGHVRATLKLLKPFQMEIEVEITPLVVDRAADRAVMEVCKILDGLRFCGISSCDCAACTWHHVIAVIRHCQRHAQFSSCEVSASILRGDLVQNFVETAEPAPWISLSAVETLDTDLPGVTTPRGRTYSQLAGSSATENTVGGRR